jgi:hypothetical protein
MPNMQLPDWFLLVRDWRTTRMGTVGITLPFLVGALAAKANNPKPSVEDILDLLHEIVDSPVKGYVTEIRWCPNTDAPVLSVAATDSVFSLPLKSHFSTVTGGTSLGFSEDIHSMFGLNCSSCKECLEALVANARPYVEAKTFSRVCDPKTGERTYGDFSEKERQFIVNTIGVSGAAKV